MIVSLARAATIFALCLAIGLHWFLLQSVAWTAMMVKYSARVSLVEAVEKTFDGAHPCSLCQAVQKGKNSENKSDLQPVAAKFNLFVTRAVSQLLPPVKSFSYQLSPAVLSTRGDVPLLPPPRFALA